MLSPASGSDVAILWQLYIVVVCVCVCVCVCVLVTRLSSLSQTLPDFSFILLGGYQQLVHAGVCGVMCVREKK